MFKRFTVALLVFILPFQLGYHFWLPQSYVKGFGIDYLSPTLYLTDILIMLFIIQNLSSLRSFVTHFFTRYYGVLVLTLIAINIYQSSGNLVTIFAWVRLIAYYYLYLNLRTITNLSKLVKVPFILSLLIVISLAFAQLIKQSSLGGIFYFLGERTISITTPNIAKQQFQISNFKYQILRPYSTFSHPNSLAGYLLVSLVILKSLTPSKVLNLLTKLTIILTISRSAIFTLIVVSLFNLSLTSSLATAAVLSLVPLLGLNPSYTSRLSLIPSSLKMISNHLFFGVGLRQFIPTLSSYIPDNQLSYFSLQPVHNLFLLIISELGLFLVVLILVKIIKSKIILNSNFQLLTSIVLLTGSLDHYWWTLPQNQLIIILALALLVNKSHTSYRSNTTHVLP